MHCRFVFKQQFGKGDRTIREKKTCSFTKYVLTGWNGGQFLVIKIKIHTEKI